MGWERIVIAAITGAVIFIASELYEWWDQGEQQLPLVPIPELNLPPEE